VATDQFLLKAAKEEGLEAYNMENKDEAEKANRKSFMKC